MEDFSKGSFTSLLNKRKAVNVLDAVFGKEIQKECKTISQQDLTPSISAN